MSFSIPPVSDPYPTPLVGETQSITDRQRAREEADRRRHQHPHPDPHVAEEQDVPAKDPDAHPTVGTLIDVRA
ncbi:MAG: hypothetical protein ABUS56_09510 [Acidobacteriota bacterium]